MGTYARMHDRMTSLSGIRNSILSLKEIRNRRLKYINFIIGQILYDMDIIDQTIIN